ncbi:MAG: putative permease [Patiriisocius sp.]
MYLSILSDTLIVTGPIFLIVLLGLVLRRIGFIDDHFNQIASRLVFSICLPVLLFTTISQIDLNDTINFPVFYFSLAGAVLTFALSWLAATFIEPRTDRGVVVQGSFRSNLGVIGLALCANAYGAPGLALASLLMASLTVSYNILSVFILSFYSNTDLDWTTILVDILKNPLIIAIAVAFVVAYFGIPVPGILLSAGDYIGSMALPLALLGTGAGMSLRALRDSSQATGLVIGLKAVLLPGILTVVAIQLGFRGTDLGVLFLLFVSPTATASYAMVKAMGANDTLAANLVMTTTLVCILSCSLGLFLLKVFNLA